MCVICYKTFKQSMPDSETVKAMWARNPDGAGLMWRSPAGRRGFSKGFMSLAAFERYLDENKEFFATAEVALHFRIGTHGGNTPENTHPFRVVAKGDTGMQEDRDCKSPILMHNGILPLKPRRPTISDTAELALRAGSFADPLSFLAAADEMLDDNKVLVFAKDGAHFYGGEWKKGSDGLLYSNLHHEFSCFSGRNFGWPVKPLAWKPGSVTTSASKGSVVSSSGGGATHVASTLPDSAAVAPPAEAFGEEAKAGADDYDFPLVPWATRRLAISTDDDWRIYDEAMATLVKAHDYQGDWSDESLVEFANAHAKELEDLYWSLFAEAYDIDEA